MSDLNMLAAMERQAKAIAQMVDATERQAAALERIAAAVEALVKTRKQCPDKGECHGSKVWCDVCGDVSSTCSIPGCIVHDGDS